MLFYTSTGEPTVSARQAVVTVDLCNTTVIEEKVICERSKLDGLKVKTKAPRIAYAKLCTSYVGMSAG